MRSEEALKPLAGMDSQSEDEDEDEDQGEYEDAADDEQDELGEVAEGEEKDGMVGEEEQECASGRRESTAVELEGSRPCPQA